MAKFFTKNANINGTTFQFVCTSRNTRSGFAHDCELTTSNGQTVNATAIYYNRTWEQYEYQSVMIKAVNYLIECRKEHLKSNYKDANNLTRLTAKHSEKLNALINSDDLIITYRDLKKSLYL